jgi:hypothetical protein
MDFPGEKHRSAMLYISLEKALPFISWEVDDGSYARNNTRVGRR